MESNTEVITQPLTFIATVNAIKYCDADPVFIDVDKDTLGLSPEKLKHWLKKNVNLDSQTNQPINQSTNNRLCSHAHLRASL